jgi:DNA repair exonuclease SbcCD ATPase subunit
MSRILLVAVWVTIALFSFSVAAEADKVDPTRRAEQYYVAAGKTYNMHAHDHARMLRKYAEASNSPVPREVIREHATAIAANVDRARQSFAKLATAAKQLPNVEKQLAEIEKRLSQVSGKIAKLNTASTDEAVDSEMLAKETSEIVNDLKATHMAGKEIDSALAQQAQSRGQFYDPNSPSYYFTGEGHFLD